MSKTALNGVRVLDLSDYQAILCGKLLADLGAEVIKVEPPKGSLCRSIPPFVEDIPNLEGSIYFLSDNINKLGITLDITKQQGQELFLRLVGQTDIIVESFRPGMLEEWNLGYERLVEVRPDLIMTSITPFGQTGPYSSYASCDLVTLALSGFLFIAGDQDRPPVRISIEQAFAQGGVHGAIGSLLALRFRNLCGQGNHVDVSMQESLALTVPVELAFWEAEGLITHRAGPQRRRGVTYGRDIWPCKDGHFGWRLLGGPLGAPTLREIIKWMEEEAVDNQLKDIDWEQVDMSKVSQKQIDDWTYQLVNFFLNHTKTEIYERALKKRMLLSPGFNAKELLEHIQLIERRFWQAVDHPELGRSILYPGSFCKMSCTPCKNPVRAPFLGQHNYEVFGKLLGLNTKELNSLKREGVI